MDSRGFAYEDSAFDYGSAAMESLFGLANGLSSFLYSWLFLLGTVNFVFPSLIVSPPGALRHLAYQVAVGLLVVLLQSSWIPLNRFFHCVLTWKFHMRKDTSEILLPLCSLGVSVIYFVDTVAVIHRVSLARKVGCTFSRTMVKVCRHCLACYRLSSRMLSLFRQTLTVEKPTGTPTREDNCHNKLCKH